MEWICWIIRKANFDYSTGLYRGWNRDSITLHLQGWVQQEGVCKVICYAYDPYVDVKDVGMVFIADPGFEWSEDQNIKYLNRRQI